MTSFNVTTATVAGILLLAVVVTINPRTLIFAMLASLSGPLYTLLNTVIGARWFPGGHAVVSLTFVSLLVLCVGGKYLRRRGLIVVSVVGATSVLFISTASLVIGGHRPSDVYGGWLCAGGWILILLSVRPIGDPVLTWLGDPEAAWHAHHPDRPYTFESRRALVAHALYTPIVQLFERLGFAVRGVLWVVMGIAVARSALQMGPRIDLYGSVRLLVTNPWRGPIATLIVIGLGGYALWGYVRTILDPLRRGTSASGLGARMGFLSSAISYTMLIAFTLVAAFTPPSRSAPRPFEPAAVVNLLAGFGAVYVLGVIVIGIGISQAIDGWREPFKHDVLTPDAPHGLLFRMWTWLGRTGLFARAVLFALVGVLIIKAHANGHSWSTSFSTAFERMAHLPGGTIAAAILGLGLVALGLHSFAAARWMRLRPLVLGTAK